MNHVQTLFNENGGPFAVFVLGHVDFATAISPAEQDRISAQFETTTDELFGTNSFQFFYLRRGQALRGCDNWFQCPPDAPGAVAATGVICR